MSSKYVQIRFTPGSNRVVKIFGIRDVGVTRNRWVSSKATFTCALEVLLGATVTYYIKIDGKKSGKMTDTMTETAGACHVSVLALQLFSAFCFYDGI